MKFKYLLSFLFLSKNVAKIGGLGQNVSFEGMIHYNLSDSWDSWSCGLIGGFNLLSDLVNPSYPKDISRTRSKNFVSIGFSVLKILDEKTIESVLFGVNVGISRELINNNWLHVNLKTAEAFFNFNFCSLLHFSIAIGVFNLKRSLKDAYDYNDYKVYFKIGGGGFFSHSTEKITFGGKFAICEKFNYIKENSDCLNAQYNRLKKDEIYSLIKYIFDIEAKNLLNEKRRNSKCSELSEDEKKEILDKIFTKQCKCSELTEDEKKEILDNISAQKVKCYKLTEFDKLFSKDCKLSELTEDEKKEVINKLFTKQCKCSELTEDEKKEILDKISYGVNNNNKDLCINGIPLYELIKPCFFQDFELFFNSSSVKFDINESGLMKLIPNENIRQTLEDLMLSSNLDELIYTSDKIDAPAVVATADTGTVGDVVVNQETVDSEAIVSVETVGDDNAAVVATADTGTVGDVVVNQETDATAAAEYESKIEMILKKENREIDKKIIKFILDQKEKFNNWMKIADFMNEDILNDEIIKSDICLSSYTRCLIDGYKNFPKDACADDKIYIRNLTFLHLYKDIMKHVKTSTEFGKSGDLENFLLSNGCLDFSINDIS